MFFENNFEQNRLENMCGKLINLVLFYHIIVHNKNN